MDEKQKLYNALVERNLYSKSFEEFDSQFSSTEKIKGLHSALKDRDLVSISPSSFQSKYFGDLDVTEKPKSPGEGSDRQGGSDNPIVNFGRTFWNVASKQGLSGLKSMATALVNEGMVQSPVGIPYAGMVPGEEIERMKSDIPEQRVAMFKSAAEGFEDFAESQEGLVTRASQVEDPIDAVNYVTNSIAQAAAQIPASVLTFGMTSIGQEIGMIYMDQVKQIAEREGISPEEVIREGKDNRASAIAYGTFAGALDYLGARGVARAVPFKQFASSVARRGLGMLKAAGREFTTEGSQSIIEQFGSSRGAGNSVFTAMTGVDLKEAGEEALAGAIGGGGLSAISVIGNDIREQKRKLKQKNLNKEQSNKIERDIQRSENILNPSSSKVDIFGNIERNQIDNPFEQSKQQQIKDNIQDVPGAQQLLEESFDETFIKPLRETKEDPDPSNEDIKDSTVDAPSRLDDTTQEGQRGAKRRGRTESREEKSGFNQDFLNNIRENTETFFKSISNKDLRGQAKEFVDKLVDGMGLDQTVGVVRRAVIDNESSLAIAQRFAIGKEIISRLNDDHVQKLEAGDPDAVIVSDKKLRFIEDFDAMATDAGRAIQSLNYGASYLPQDFVRIYEKIVNEFKKDDSFTARVRDFFRDKFGKTTRQELGVEQEVIDEINKRASKLKDIPEGQFREEAAREIFRYINEQVPTNITNLGVAIGYANILSSHETQAVNFGNTGLNVLFDAITLNIARPDATKEIWTGLVTGFEKGKTESKSALKSGKARTGRQRGKGIKEQRPLERLFERIQIKEGDSAPKRIGKRLLRPVAALRWVRRVMVASDVLWFKSSEQMRSAVLARDIAKKEGITDQNEISKRVNEVLHNTDELKQQAEFQAEQEGFTGLNIKRRASEIVDNNKPIDVQISSQEFANKSRYTQEPEGILGAATNAVEQLSRLVPPLKIAVPFTRVVANVANNLIDYSPAGYTRLFAATKWGQKIKNVPEGDLWAQQAAKATLGTIATMVPAIINALNFDEDDPFIYFHGRGPQNFKDRFQLQETGWKEYSLQVGDSYFSFKETIFALPLAAVGNYYDAIKYDDLDEEDVIGRVAFVMNNSPRVILDQSFLAGLSDLFTALSSERLVDDTSPVKTVIDKVRPFALPNLIRKIDQTFDPRITTSDNIKESLARDIPFVRTKVGKPILNVLGEPIRQDYSFSDRIAKRFFSTHKSDPVWNTIVEKNAFVSTPSQSGTKITERDGDVRDMNPTEFYNFTIIRGRNIKRTLRVNLSRIRRMSPGDAQKFVDKISANATESAKTELKKRGLVGNDRILEPNK